MTTPLHVGFLINPVAGLGGVLARKGSDGQTMRDLAAQLPVQQRLRGAERALRCLAVLDASQGNIQFTTWAGDMGATTLAQAGIAAQVLGSRDSQLSSASDTRQAAAALLEEGIDLLLFVGGDGTARDILDVVAMRCPVLGIPAGVKMHSGVFAVSPEAAGELLARLGSGGLVSVKTAEVRDIDEEAMRADRVKSRFYGEMKIPAVGDYLQHTKVGGRESTELVAAEIGAWLVETMDPDRLYLVGPGSTTAAITDELGLPTTLLGVDVVRGGQIVASDADEKALLQLLDASSAPANIIVTAIGGQGHVFGRGNQQFSPAVIRKVGLDNIQIVAAKSKITALGGRPLLVDTNDAALDRALLGYYEIVSGYDDKILYPIGQVGHDDSDE